MAGRYPRNEGRRPAAAGDPTRAGLRAGRLGASAVGQDADLRDRLAKHPLIRRRTHGGLRRCARRHAVAENLKVLCAVPWPAVVDRFDRYSLTAGGNRLWGAGPDPMAGHWADGCTADVACTQSLGWRA